MSQEYGRGAAASEPEDEPVEDANGRAPGHPFHGLTEAEIQRRLDRVSGESATVLDDAATADTAPDDVEWRDLWDAIDAVVGVDTCEILSTTQVRLLAELHGLPPPSRGDYPDELDAAWSDCGTFRGFVLADKEPINRVPKVGDLISSSRLWGSTDNDRSGDADG